MTNTMTDVVSTSSVEMLTPEQMDAIAAGSLTDSIPALIEHAVVSAAKAVVKAIERGFTGPV